MLAARALLLSVLLALPASSGPVAVDSDEATALAAFARRVRASGTAIDDATTLAPFFAALDRGAEERVNIAFFGNSLIAADRIVNVVRRRLIEQIGDGGRGFLLADRLAAYGPRDRTARTASGWTACTLGDVTPLPAARGVAYGIAGIVHVADVAGARSVFSLQPGDAVATVFGAVARGRGALQARFDQGPWLDVVTVEGVDLVDSERTASVVHRLAIPVGSRTLELKALSAKTVVHGVAVESERGGVVVDTFGVPAVDATLWLGTDPWTISTHLAARDPDLAVIMLGGNETKRVAWRRRDVDAVENDLRALIHRVRDVDDTPCLIIGPIDAVVGKDAAEPFRQRPQLEAINALHRVVAHDEGCGYLDLFAAMGGRGSLGRFNDAGAVHDDLVHPKGRGLDVLGHLIAESLFDAWRATPVDVQTVNR